MDIPVCSDGFRFYSKVWYHSARGSMNVCSIRLEYREPNQTKSSITMIQSTSQCTTEDVIIKSSSTTETGCCSLVKSNSKLYFLRMVEVTLSSAGTRASRDGKSKEIYRYIDQSVAEYISICPISREIYRYIRYIGRNISTNYFFPK